MTVTRMAMLLRNAKIAQEPLTIARRMSLMKATVSFRTIPIQLGSPQRVTLSFKVNIVDFVSQVFIKQTRAVKTTESNSQTTDYQGLFQRNGNTLISCSCSLKRLKCLSI